MKMNLFWSSFVSFSTTLLALEGTVQLEQIQHSAALAVLEHGEGLVDKDYLRNWVGRPCTRNAGIAGWVMFLI